MSHVSVWLGKLHNKTCLNKLLSQSYTEDGELISSVFSNLFQCGSYSNDYREATYFDNTLQDFKDAFSRYSYIDEFLPELEQNIDDEDPNEYNTIIMLYNFTYSPKISEVSDKQYGYLKFINTFRYDYSQQALLTDVSTILGELPWEYEKKVYRLSKDKRKCLFNQLEELNTLQDLEIFLSNF